MCEEMLIHLCKDWELSVSRHAGAQQTCKLGVAPLKLQGQGSSTSHS